MGVVSLRDGRGGGGVPRGTTDVGAASLRDGRGGCGIHVLEGQQGWAQHPWGTVGVGTVSMSLRDGRGRCSILGKWWT